MCLVPNTTHYINLEYILAVSEFALGGLKQDWTGHVKTCDCQHRSSGSVISGTAIHDCSGLSLHSCKIQDGRGKGKVGEHLHPQIPALFWKPYSQRMVRAGQAREQYCVI